MQSALERFLAESHGSAALGAVEDHPAEGTAMEREAAAFEKLMAQRQALVEGGKWRSTLPVLLIVVLAAIGVTSAMTSHVAGAIGVAVAAATATMFRLLAAVEAEKARAMVFTMVQLAQRDGKYPPVELVELLLRASRDPKPARPAKYQGAT